MISRLLGSWGWGTFTRQKNHGPEFIGGRHWAFVAADAAIARMEKREADDERPGYHTAALKIPARLRRKIAVKQRQEDREEAEAAARAAALDEAEQAARLEEAARKEKQKDRKELQKERARLRSLVQQTGADEAVVSRVCAGMELQELQETCAELQGLGGDTAAMRGALESRARRLEATAAKQREEMEERLRAYIPEGGTSSGGPWSEEELRLLQKALAKFPQGTSRRWDQIAAMLPARTLEEVVRMVKVNMAAGNTDLQRQSQGLQIAKKRRGNLAIRDQATARAEVFADVQLSLKGDAAVLYGGEAEEAVDRPGDSDAWTDAQELALVKALKVFGKDLGQERWVRVAEAVPGKSKVECFRRFKHIRESFRSTQGVSADQ